MGQSAIAFVPARKNSKRLPGKNKKLLNGLPLFRYTVDAALQSSCYEMVVLTTDDEEIIKIGNDIHGLTVIKRPDEFAGDNVRAKDVVLYHLKEIDKDFDFVSLLMPTSPFRDEKDIRKSFEVLGANKGDSLASVVEYDFHPALALKMSENRMYSYFDKRFNWVREDQFEKAYHLNGAIFTCNVQLLLKTRTFIQDGTLAFIMDDHKSLDIDDVQDFKYAEAILKGKFQ